MWCDMGGDEPLEPEPRGLRLSKASRSELKKRIRELEEALSKAVSPPSILTFTQLDADGRPVQKAYTFHRGEAQQVSLARMYLDGEGKPVFDLINVEVKAL